MRLDISCESSAMQRIHMEHQVLFSSKDKKKRVKCHLLPFSMAFEGFKLNEYTSRERN